MRRPDHESATRYLSHRELWESYDNLYRRSTKDSSDVEIGIVHLLTLIQQAAYPLWPNGHLVGGAALVVFSPKDPDGVPHHGVIHIEENGEACASVYSEEVPAIEMLEGMESGEIVPPVVAVEFIMSNPTLMKGFRYWLKMERKRRDHE